MRRLHKAILAGVLTAAACLGLVAWSSVRETDFRRQELHREARLTARGLATHLGNALEKHLIALGQLATFFENSVQVTEAEFHTFAEATLKRTPLCQRISIVDPTAHVRWVHPLEPNRALVGFDIRRHAPGYETYLQAMRTRQPAISPPLELIDGPRGFVLAVPMYKDDRYIGEGICSFESRRFFASVAQPEVLERYEEMVLSSGAPVFTSQAFHAPASIEPAVENLVIAGSAWEVRVTPRESIVAHQLGSGQAALWTLGGLLALGIGCAVGTGVYWASAIALRLRSQGVALRETRVQLDGALRQLLQAEKMTALGELVAGVAHEINNPLATIMGYTQLLMAKNVPPEVKRRLEVMGSEADRMARIVGNLLTFARKHPPEKKYLGLNGIIEKTLELKAYRFKVSQITIRKELAPDLPKSMMDFNQMQQVFLNLLNNAEQAIIDSASGGTIRLTTGMVDGRIEARVSDDGPGVPEGIQSRIFEPFFTTKQEGKGTGLGLSLCYGIIQEHGGSIRVESRPRQGATFVIGLPVVEDRSAGVPVAAGKPASTVTPLRILVIDDEPALQDLLVELLRSRGHQVDTASDVPEALRKIAANGHDLIISDMKMPQGSGKDIYKAVIDRSPRLARRIVFTTGDGTSVETRQFLQEAGNEIVLKPFTIEQIEAAIASAARN